MTTGNTGGKIGVTSMNALSSGVPVVVGRQDELASLDRFLAAGDGLPAALVLEGEAGIGKTTLWRSAVAAASTSYRVLSAQPVAAEAELSHASLADLLEPCVEEVLPELARPQRRALESALLLAELEGEPPQPRAVAAGFLAVLRALARDGPVLVALDDVQWLDTSSRAVLEFALRRLRSEPVAALVSFRTDTDRRALSFGPAFDPERLTRLRLEGLDMPAVQTLLRERLGLALTRPTLLQVVDASGGNPFFALELGRVLEGRPVAPGEPLPVPPTLKELVARRLALLPPETVDALRLAALAGDCDVGLLARALARDPWQALRPAIEAEVVEVAGDRVRFTHPLLASVSRAGTDPAQRRDAHARLATAVVDPEQQARHLALAADGPDPAVAAALDHAAEDASRRGAPAAAAELAGLAADLTPADAADERADRLIAAAEHHQLAGEHTVTRSLLEPLVATLPPGPRRARALFCLGWTESMGRGRELCEQALDEADGQPALTAAIRHVLGYVGLVAGRIEWARAAELGGRISGHAGQDLGHRSGLNEWIAAQLAAHEGLDTAAALAAEAVIAGGGLEIRGLEMQGLLGFLELSRGNAAEAARLLEPLPARLLELGYGEPSHLQAIPNLVEAYVELGRLDEARTLLEPYERIARALDHPLGLVQAARCSGLLAAATGDVDAALALFDAALAFELPQPLENGRTLLARGIVLRRAKRRRDARDALEEARAIFERLGAARWEERARGELARVAGRAPSRETLTATERRVADLVAEGRSNKEVAAALFVTVKGVEAHLSRIYRKLGVRSRAELMRLYATRGAP